MKLNLQHFVGWAALFVCLQFTHLALAEHGVEHAFHDHDEVCIECLSLPGFLTLSVQPPRLPRIGMAATIIASAVPPAPTFAPCLSFRSRAPPPFQSI